MDENKDAPIYANDAWTAQDDFGMAASGEELAKILLQAPPPFAARVVGKWGAGKTSILRRAFSVLGGVPVSKAVPLGENRNERDYSQARNLSQEHRAFTLDWDDNVRQRANQSLCIWYSPWQHQGSDNPILPLLKEIQAQFTTWMKVKDKIKSNMRSALLTASTLIEKTADVAMTLSFQKNVNTVSGTTKAVMEAWKEGQDELETLGDGQRFHLLFEDAVEKVLEAICKANRIKVGDRDQPRLIIFIDDLDRCEEAQAVNLLESIKLYLNTSNCVFVLALDDTALLHILERQWPGRYQGANREYLEKLFQLTMAVPPPRVGQVEDVLSKQLASHGFPEDCASEIVALMEPNPRKLKNFTNSVCAAAALARPKTRQEGIWLIMAQYLRQFHQPVWRLIEREHSLFKVLHEVLLGSAVNQAESALAREMLARRFAHILPNTSVPSPDTDARFRNMTMDKAVDHILGNIDEKRSDTRFRFLMKTQVDPENLEPVYRIFGLGE